MEQFRCIHVSKKNPYVTTKILKDNFSIENDILESIEKLIIGNALNLVIKDGWQIVLNNSNEENGSVSLLLVKNF